MSIKNGLVVKSNTLIQASYRLSLEEQRLILCSLGSFDHKTGTNKTVSVTASQFSSIFGIDQKNAARELYKAADELFERTITLNDTDKATKLRWIQKQVLQKKGEGAVELTFSDDVIKYISQLKEQFTSYRLRHVSDLKSIHSIRLYELLVQFIKTKKRVFKIDEFKSVMGIENLYPDYRNLNRRVITKSVNELNKKSDLSIIFSTEKKGRAIDKLVFEFDYKGDSNRQSSFNLKEVQAENPQPRKNRMTEIKEMLNLK